MSGTNARRLLAILAAGLLLRLAWWAYADSVPVSDFWYYRRYAVHLLDTGVFGFPQDRAYRTPGYPAFLAGLMIVSRSIAWLSFATAVFSACLPAVVYAAASKLTRSTAVGLTAATLTAISPTFVLFSPVLASEHLSSFLLFSSLACACHGASVGGKADAARPAVAGLLCGAAILARPDSIFYLPVFASVTWISPSSRGRVRIAAFLIATLVVVGPWLVRNRVVVGPGAGLSTAGGVSFYYAHNSEPSWYHPLAGTPMADLGELERSKRGYALGWTYLTNASPVQLVSDLRHGTGRFFDASDNYAEFWSTRSSARTPDEVVAGRRGERMRFGALVAGFNYFLFGAGALALLAVRRYPARTWFVLYGMVLVSWIGYCAVFAAISRYRYCSDVALIMLAAMTIGQVSRARMRFPLRPPHSAT